MAALGIGHAGALVGRTWLVTMRLKPSARSLRVLEWAAGGMLVALASYFFWLGLGWGVKPGPRLP